MDRIRQEMAPQMDPKPASRGMSHLQKSVNGKDD